MKSLSNTKVAPKKHVSKTAPKRGKRAMHAVQPAATLQSVESKNQATTTDGGSERCYRCQGLAVQERYDDTLGSYEPVMLWRCINCGNVY